MDDVGELMLEVAVGEVGEEAKGAQVECDDLRANEGGSGCLYL